MASHVVVMTLVSQYTHLKILLKIRMTETRFYEPARLSTPVKPLFSLKPLDANLGEVIFI